ncbi:hypothetical protein K227x_31960 [Rubripirellula lacrimiformis]|uniref:BON domain protein n=1 Tax=Rubripirellula lacrimiformis TaxID=1930273 RepID=A0A517NCD9_9BACT|nr:hypothetical protein [Rubripirellula lacrimiformis]QDT04799.1 hypothetical protein K227x_31960 [Rubripirellula lacrimiformis]
MNQSEPQMTETPIDADSPPNDVDLKQRVNESLLKLGYVQAKFVSETAGKVTIECTDTDRNDQCVMQVAVRLLPGVTSVAFVASEGAR